MKRSQVIDYIKNKYGHDKVCQMATFGRMQGRSAIKEVLRINAACSFEEMNVITIWYNNKKTISLSNYILYFIGCKWRDETQRVY